MDARQAQRVGDEEGPAQGLLSLPGWGGRDDGVDQFPGCLHQDAGRLAPRVPLDPTAGRIWRPRADPCRLQGQGVAPEQVAVFAGQGHGVVGCDPIQVLLAGEPLIPQVVIPTPAPDPGPRLRADDSLTHQGHGLGQGIHPLQVDLLQGQGVVQQMDVGITEARHHGPPFQVNALRPGDCGLPHLVGPSHGDNPPIAQGDRLGPRVLVVHGIDGRIEEQQALGHGSPMRWRSQQAPLPQPPRQILSHLLRLAREGLPLLFGWDEGPLDLGDGR